ncbi:uncharacterized protein LOC126592771 [Malus sylvestris]|uniref:uncharacterized protein LOC126592771 n=1 Tax=Malus sylvestris TaxID=3752 RepID=UPI0021ACEF2A|nr:uncharacterized protein LOC126592771 [Malus sylvestris]
MTTLPREESGLPASELYDSERLKRPRISGRSRKAPPCKHCQMYTHDESDCPCVDPNPVCVFSFVHNNCGFIGHWAGTCPYENGCAERPAPPARPKSVAYVNNCPPDIEQKELEELFGTVGPIFEAVVTPPLNDTWPYALASVYYVEKDDAQKAFDKLNGWTHGPTGAFWFSATATRFLGVFFRSFFGLL